MKIRLLSGIEGAQAADGSVVVIDVFRASNTIIALLAAGARAVIPVATLGEARAWRRTGRLIGGERQGIQPKDFDFGNSPAAAARMQLCGRDVVFTTSAGTKGLLAPQNADQILIGSFANAQALCRHLRGARAGRISLVAMGLRGREKAEEDELCAAYIRDLLEDRPTDIRMILGALTDCKGAQRLRRLGQHDDLEYCLRPDHSDAVPRVRISDGRRIVVSG